MTRDSLFLIVSCIGSAAVGMTASFHLFPWIPDTAQHWISLIAFLYSTVSAKLQTSPLKRSTDQDAKQ